MARYALILAAACGFILSAVSGIFLVPFLRRIHFGQTIKEIGPTWHNKKQEPPPWAGCALFLAALWRWRLPFIAAADRAGACGGRGQPEHVHCHVLGLCFWHGGLFG